MIYPKAIINLKNLKDNISNIASEFYNHPSKKINLIGVTGTNGKTSSVYWITQCLKHLERKATMISTIGYGFIDNLQPTLNTTPDALKIQSIINDFSFDPIASGYEYDFFDQTKRSRQTDTHEIRFHNDETNKISMLFGLHSTVTNEKDTAEGWLFGGDASNINSHFNIANIAGYGQFIYLIKHRTRIIFNLRSERHTIAYNGELK